MEVRPVRLHEHEALGALTVAAYGAISPVEWQDDLDEYEAELRDVAGRVASAEVLVAVDDGALLGGVTYVPGPSSPLSEFSDADAAGIRMLAVAPSAQRRGVGEALTRACVARAVATGRAQILLHSTPWMTGAHRLYERLGFHRDTSLDWEAGPDLHLWGFRLLLADVAGAGGKTA